MHLIQLQVYVSNPQNPASPVLLIAQATRTVTSYSLISSTKASFADIY